MIARQACFRTATLWQCALFALGLSGCANQALLPTYLPDGPPPAVELADTPFFPQDKYQCGPAALATVLAAAGAAATPDELTPLVFLPARKGSLQPELVATVRRYQHIPYVIDPDLGALLAEVASRRPVLVLQNLGASWYPIWHYAVVVGYRPETDQILLRSATTKRKVVDAKRFLNSWQLAGSWGFVVLNPGELPVRVDADRYLQAVTVFESTGQYAIALAAYQAALTRWPTDTRAQFGAANSLLGLGRAAEATVLYQRLLAAQPNHVAALNNLAEALAAQSCTGQAVAVMERAIALPDVPPALMPLLEKTRADLRRRNEATRQDARQRHAALSCPTTPN